MALDTKFKQEVIKKFAVGKGDTGSPEVQIALLSEKINKLAVALDVTAEFLVSSPESSPGDKVADEAFFRKYQLLPDPEKKKLRKILDAWEDE